LLTLLRGSLRPRAQVVKIHRKIVGWTAGLLLASGGLAASSMLAGCSHERPRAPAPSPPASSAAVAIVDAGPPPVTPEPAPETLQPREPYRTALTLRGAQLYLPPWFSGKKGLYDLIVHFHGEGRWQEQNVERVKLNVAVVSINLGLGTEPYSNTFKNPEVFERLLADVQAEVTKDGRAGPTPKLHRLALSAWSAGFSSVSRVMTDAVAPRVDAVLLADGFFTNFTDRKKRTVNKQGLERFVKLAEQARKDEKLFSITHTTIPTGPYPSVQECVGTLLELEHLKKKQCSIDGPRPKMHQFYTVDEGSFHIHGFQGVRAADHVRQLHAMGETTYPYLKSRWDKQDAEAEAAH
jgi:hypothetical protein